MQHVSLPSTSLMVLAPIVLGMSDCYEVLSPPRDPERGTLCTVFKHHDYEYPKGRYFYDLANFVFSKELKEEQMKMLRKNKEYRRIFVLCKKMARDAVGFSFDNH